MNYMRFIFISLIAALNLNANFLNEKIPKILKESKTTLKDFKNRKREDIVLESSTGNIKFAISFPKKIKKNENILILLNGLETGRNSLKYIFHPSNYIIIGYEFPKNLLKLKNKSALVNFLELRKAALHVPTQLICIEKWIKNQPWYSKKNISIAGVSFGAIFVPATYHLAAMNNIKLGPCVMAFGGAGLYDIFYSNIKTNKILKAPLAYSAYLNFKPLDPVFHLSYIQSKCLIINAAKDENMPFKSAQKLQLLTPEPKTIINVDSGHISPDNQNLINQISEISLKWLNENQ